MRLRERLGLGPTRREIVAVLEATREQLTKAQQESARLEGLLDGVSGDPDSQLSGLQNSAFWRQIRADGSAVNQGRDFDETKRNELMSLTHRAFALRPDAHDIVETHLDYILGEDGLAPKAKDEADSATQDALDEVWKDDRNRLEESVEATVLSMMLEGEMFWLADLNTMDGRLELAPIAPETVSGVLRNRHGADVAITTRGPSGLLDDERRYFLLDRLTERIEIVPANGPKAEKWAIVERDIDRIGQMRTTMKLFHGLAFAWFSGRPLLALRGRTVLTEVLDYVDMHDQHVWATLEREKLLRQFVMHVKSSDINKDNAKQKLKEFGLAEPPTSPTVIATNDKVSIDLLQATVQTGTFKDLERTMRMLTYGAKGFPEHWSGSAGDSNLATAQAQESKPLRRLRRLQKSVVAFYRTIMRVSLDLKVRAGVAQAIPAEKWHIQVTEIGGKDRQRGADVLQKVAASIVSAVSQSLMTREAGNAIVIQAARDCGFTVDPKDAGVPPEPELDPNDLLDRVDRATAGSDAQDRGARGDSVRRNA